MSLSIFLTNFSEIQSLNPDWGNYQHAAHVIGGSISTMNGDVTTYDTNFHGNEYNPESFFAISTKLCNPITMMLHSRKNGFQQENLQQMVTLPPLLPSVDRYQIDHHNR